VLTKFISQAEWALDISQTKVLMRSSNKLELQQTYRAGYTFGFSIEARLSVQETPPKGFSYKMIQGDRLNTLQGSWSIQPVAGGVQLKHQMQVDPKTPGPLRPFYYEQQEQNLRHWMTILKRRMEADDCPHHRRSRVHWCRHRAAVARAW
jgi:hypothetical protein